MTILEFNQMIKRDINTIVENAFNVCSKELEDKAKKKLRYIKKENNRKRMV